MLHLQRRLVDRHLLPVIGIVEPGDQCALVDPFAFVERQFDDARLHRLEAEHALVRFDVAGHHDRGGGRRSKQPCEWRRLEIGRQRPPRRATMAAMDHFSCSPFCATVSIFARRAIGACIAWPPL